MAVKASATVTIADISDGTDGTGIKSTKIEYKAGSSGTTAPTGTWSASVPATSASAPYLWTRVTYTYTDGSPDKVVYNVGSTPEGISVGGRNLQLGSRNWDSTAFYTQGNASISGEELTVPSNSTSVETHFINVKQNEVYTVGFDVKCNTSISNANTVLIEFFNSSNERTSFSWIVANTTTAWQRIVRTFTVTDSAAVNMRMGLRSSITSPYVNTYRLLKIEKGNKATDWTPAPEDIYSKIETEASQKANEAAKTATNYMKLDETAGLVIGNLTGSTLGKNVKIKNDRIDICNGNNVLSSYGDEQTIIGVDYAYNILIDSDSIDIRHGTTVRSSFLGNSMYIGMNGETATINLSNARGFISYYSNEGSLNIDSDAQLKLEVPDTGNILLRTCNTLNSTSGSLLLMDHSRYTVQFYEETRERNVTGQWNMSHSMSSFSAGCVSGTPQAYMNLYNTYGDTTKSIELKGLNDINILGSDLVFQSTKAGTDTYRPYYRKGDVIQFSGYTAGYVSNSATRVYFTIPISKPIIGSPTLSGSSVNGFKIRQSGSYTHGSTSNSYVIPSSYTLTLIGDGAAIRAYATFSDTTNAKNNYPCGIQVSMNITLS